MSSTTFVDYQKPTISASWLNDVNAYVYGSGLRLSLASTFGVVANGIVDDTIAAQAAVDSLQSGQTLFFNGNMVLSNPLYVSNKTNVTLDFTNCTVTYTNSSGFSLVVHGGVLTRNALTLGSQMLSVPYEGTTPCYNVRVKGYKVVANSGRKATQVCFFFADDCEADLVVSNSNGNGVEFRQCVNPKFTNIVTSDINAYGLFIYQCHGLKGAFFKCSNSGRAYEIKQRHKFYSTLDHQIDNVVAVDLIGFSDPAWCTGGQSYNDLVTGGFPADQIAARNFPGHEISKNVTIRNHDLTVSNTASGSVTNPSVQIGTFADTWDFDDISLEANGKDITTQPLGIGSRGDTVLGIANGATFGQNHRITNVKFSNFTSINSNANSLIYYGVSGSVINATYAGCTVARIVLQNDPTVLPFGGQVGYLELRNHIGAINLYLGPVAERGFRISPETQRFISGGNNLTITPVNSSSGTDVICTPWYIRSPNWITIGRDELTILASGASNWTTTYGFYTEAASGNVLVKFTGTAPTNLRGLGFANTSSTKALVLQASELVMTGAPSSERSAIKTDGEISVIGNNIFTGGWINTVLDTTGGTKNSSQNLKRQVYLTAAPTTGSWNLGDRTFNSTPAVGQPKAWICTVTGTPGTWVSEGNL